MRFPFLHVCILVLLASACSTTPPQPPLRLDSVSFVNTGPVALHQLSLTSGRSEALAFLESVPPYRELAVPATVEDYQRRFLSLTYVVDGKPVRVPGWQSPAPASLDRSKPYNLRIQLAPDGSLRQDLERVEVLRARLHAAATPGE